MSPRSPDLDVTNHGYIKDEETQSSTLQHKSHLYPRSQKTSCGCSGDDPCKRKQCGCHRKSLACSMFCNCYTRHCHNPHTPAAPNQEITPAQSNNTNCESSSDDQEASPNNHSAGFIIFIAVGFPILLQAGKESHSVIPKCQQVV